ncbi:MAG: heme exporter protein CcmD [Pseudomonadota bacterium]
MSWASATDFLAMGGYALFVWTAYGVTALALAGEVLLLRRRAARALTQAGQRARGDAA